MPFILDSSTSTNLSQEKIEKNVIKSFHCIAACNNEEEGRTWKERNEGLFLIKH